MVEFLFKIGIIAACIVAVLAAITAIPSVAALISVATDSTDLIVTNINGFVNTISQYARPFVALMNRILSVEIKNILVSLIIWFMIKPLVYKIVDLTSGLARKIVEKT